MQENKLMEWARKHKFFTGIILFFSLIILLSILSIINTYITRDDYSYIDGGQPYTGVMESREPSAAYDSFGAFDFDFGLGLNKQEEYLSSDSTDLEIREGSITVKSEDADNDFESLKSILEQKEGHVETSRKNETNTRLYINAKVRIPSENFDDFVEQAQELFEVEDFELSNYKINVQRQADEMDIINQALKDYNFLREETLKMENSEERINLLSMITREMQYLSSQQRQLERDLGDKEAQSDLATITFVFEQKLKADLWPEDLGNVFNDELNWAIDTIAKSFISILTNSFVLLVKVVEFIVYAIIIIVPVVYAYKLAKKLIKRKSN